MATYKVRVVIHMLVKGCFLIKKIKKMKHWKTENAESLERL